MDFLLRIREDLLADLRTNGGIPGPFDLRSVGVLVTASILLTLFYYFARPNFYRAELDLPIARALDLINHPYRGLLPYWYWALSSITLRILIPLAFIVFLLKESPRDFGFRLWERGHGRFYLALYLMILPVLATVSFLPSFQSKYPFYKAAWDSGSHFVLYEIAYGIQFFSLEAFFRGFLVFALFRRFGYHAVVIMTVPYCMIHFGKPVPETLGAILAGLVLGYAALKSRSWLPGAFLHWGVGISMDILSMLQRHLIQA